MADILELDEMMVKTVVKIKTKIIWVLGMCLQEFGLAYIDKKLFDGTNYDKIDKE